MKLRLLPSTLGFLAVGRDNNLNLLRFLAATAVMISHTPLITLGLDKVPNVMWLLGSVAVWVFFAISGFLISASFERAPSRIDFAVARVLRIFPALAICIVLTALVVGPLVTDLPLSEYLTSEMTRSFVLGNLSLFLESRELPGVFTDHPANYAQVTFWTLKHEMACYMMVLVLGSLGIYRQKHLFLLFLAIYLILWTMGLYVESVARDTLPHGVSSFLNLSIYFVLGMAAHVFRDRLHLSAAVAVGLVSATLAFWWTPAFHILMPLGVTYSTLWLAFVPRGPLLWFNRLGDYSYGIYIFAIPVQQLCVTILGPQSPAENFAYAALPSLGLAILSWHLIERPSISARARIRAGLADLGDPAIQTR